MATTTADIRAVVSAQDNGASATISGFGKSLGGLNLSMGNIVQTALGFSLANVMAKASQDVVGFVKSSLTDFGAFQAAQAQIQSVLKSTGNQYHLSSSQVDELGSSLQKNTTFTKIQTDQSLDLLLSMKNLGTVGIGNVLSMSADLAVRMGKDLPSASQLLGRALQDPANSSRLLRSAGLDLSTQLQKQIKDMQASGNIAGAQGLLMDALKQKVGGAAQAYGNTFPGEVAKARRELESFKVTIGGDMVKGLQSLGEGLIHIIKVMQPLVEQVVNFLKPAFEQLTKVFETQLMPQLQHLWDAIQPGFTEALKVLGILVGVIIVGAIYIFVNALKFISEAIALDIHVISDIIGWIGNYYGVLVNFGKGVVNIFKDIGSLIVEPFKVAFNQIADLWNDTLGKVSIKVPSWVPGIGGKGFDFPQIPKLASGGIIPATPGGTLALLGEGGQDEAVVPLKNGTPLGGSTTNNNVTVNVNINAQAFMGSQIQARQFAMQIFNSLQDYAASKNTSVAALVAKA